MKGILLIVFVFLHSILSAQIVFIYIDPNSFQNKDNLILELKTNEFLRKEHKLISFISNDLNPIVGSSIHDFVRNMNFLNEIRPNLPNSDFDVDTLNNVFLPFDLNTEQFVMHVYTNFYDAKNTIIPNVINRFLICNDLMNKNGFNENVKIIFHLKSDSSEYVTQYQKYLKKLNYEVYFF